VDEFQRLPKDVLR